VLAEIEADHYLKVYSVCARLRKRSLSKYAIIPSSLERRQQKSSKTNILRLDHTAKVLNPFVQRQQINVTYLSFAQPMNAEHIRVIILPPRAFEGKKKRNYQELYPVQRTPLRQDAET
jgi:hypothetical protein